MAVAWGLVVLITSAVAWGGQLWSWFAPTSAARMGLAEAEEEVDPTFWLDARGEALWDLCNLWVMPVAGVLLIVGHDWWSYFGLIGGGMYLYFAGRGIVVRLVLRRHDVRVGSPSSVRVGLIALAVWGSIALVTIGAAIVSLEPT
jgi:hypothetical protein